MSVICNRRRNSKVVWGVLEAQARSNKIVEMAFLCKSCISYTPNEVPHQYLQSGLIRNFSVRALIVSTPLAPVDEVMEAT